MIFDATMHWAKKGWIFAANGQYPWMSSHAQMPLAEVLDAHTLRIYFATRDPEGHSVVAFAEVSAEDPRKILRLSERPALGLGALGCFDDSGVLPSWIAEREGKKYLFYIGVNTSTTVPGRTAIGLAASTDGGETFERIFAGPILDRAPTEPHLCTAPCVLPGAVWRMWYVSGAGWELIRGRPEPAYHIRYTESANGIDWRRPGTVAINFKDASEAGLGRPSVIRDGERYRMWFCARGREGYRSAGPTSYRIRYAESRDGLRWSRLNEQPGIDCSEAGWDSEMIAYPYVCVHRGRLYMFYNGNGFGQSGFGYAVLEEAEHS